MPFAFFQGKKLQPSVPTPYGPAIVRDHRVAAWGVGLHTGMCAYNEGEAAMRSSWAKVGARLAILRMGEQIVALFDWVLSWRDASNHHGDTCLAPRNGCTHDAHVVGQERKVEATYQIRLEMALHHASARGTAQGGQRRARSNASARQPRD